MLPCLVVAFVLRAYGLDWDRGLYFHPDERRILMVVEALHWPQDVVDLLAPASSLNPRFFAYGSLPIYTLRLLASLAGLWRGVWASMSRFCLLGRLLSALLDTLTVLATYILAYKVFNRRVAVLAAWLVALTVLHIQLAHFYTVDTMLTTLVMLAVIKAVDVAREGRVKDGAVLGVCLGAAMASKFSALPLGFVLVLAWLAYGWQVRAGVGSACGKLRTVWRQVRRAALVSAGVAIIAFLLLEPYAAIDWYHFGEGIGQEVGMSQGWFDFPYTRQYAGTAPFVYMLQQILLFAAGVPLGLLGLAGLAWLVVGTARRRTASLVVFLSWPLLYGALQGLAYAKFIRYALPLLPFLCISGAAMWVSVWEGLRRSTHVARPRFLLQSGWLLVVGAVLVCTSFYALAFLNVYRQVHPWIQASAWLCEHAPEGSTLLVEYWDDPLPVGPGNDGDGCARQYTHMQLDMYSLEGEGQSEVLLEALQRSDYIVLSSQRLYAPITRLSHRYPLASRYYQQLFAEQLGFRLVAAPTVFPQLAGVALVDDPRAGLTLSVPPLLAERVPPGLALSLGQADESFTVYDHPQPLVFQKVRPLNHEELQGLLGL